MPKVSIIVPVYNVEVYLEKCLDSIVNQTLKDIEIIIINDGSPDNSQEIIDKYPNLKIHLHSISRVLVTIIQQKIKNHRIGFVIHEQDLNFIDVDYYVMTMNAFNDTIIDLLLKENKEIILYIHSDYYISFVYNHYLSEKSTAHLQEVFQKINILTNYPEIIHKVFIEG